ncbi:methyltransferase domain-containing protein [Thalassospira sp.]|uniref:methyltransferase domain-containing protein n=1 Tax=Thalassospira sp. TaxID=1912094 RepID=UPI003AA897E5
MTNTHWDPNQYGLFGDERRRPATDLIARLPKPAQGFNPANIVDLGCGPGTVTSLLVDAYATSGNKPVITGVDHSAEMLDKARAHDDRIIWQQSDIASWEPDAPIDLLFSNAALQWVPGHASLLPRLLNFVKPGGLVAIQVPNNFLAPSHQLINEAGEKWEKNVAAAQDQIKIMRPGDYFDVLAPICSNVDLWQTQYCHVLRGEDPVFNWVSSTALRPVLANLPDDDARTAFCDHYKTRLSQVYPPRPDGITLFPFNRLFIVASKA